MKKLALALVCLIGVAFFTSCDPVDVVENNPSIEPLVEDGYVLNQANVNELDTVYFGFKVASNPETLAKLATLIVSVDDQRWDSLSFTDVTEYTYKSGVIYTPAKDSLVRTSTISAIVTDVEGKSSTATIEVNIFFKEQPLTTTEFTWNRHGAAAVTGGIEKFGLQWTSNGKEVFAEIRPMDGATLYEFDPSVWSTTNTVLDKTALFSEQQQGILVFNKVSAWAGHDDYNYVIGTTYNGENHLIHITKGEVFTFKGTDVTIYGEAK